MRRTATRSYDPAANLAAFDAAHVANINQTTHMSNKMSPVLDLIHPPVSLEKLKRRVFKVLAERPPRKPKPSPYKVVVTREPFDESSAWAQFMSRVPAIPSRRQGVVREPNL